jgi:hypothetical protein
MKKIAGKIAMVLILVIAANSFTGCLSYHVFGSGGGLGDDPISLVIGLGVIAIDIVTLPVQILVGIGILISDGIRDSRGRKIDDIDTFSQVIRTLPEEKLASLMQAIDSMPEEELASFTQRFYSLPEAELAPFTETINSFSETEIYAIAAAFNNLSETEIFSSMETLNSMPDEIFIAALNDAQNIEFRYQH